MSVELKKRLDRTAKRLKKTRNQTINEAVTEFLAKRDRETKMAELERQGRIAAEHDKTNPDVAYWEKVAEDSRKDWWDEVK